MWFSLFATVLILAITFYEGLQGLFTALINCILAILAAALAFGVYEDLYFGMLKEYQPEHGRAIALLSVFIIALLVLRTLFDILVKGNLQFPVYLDRGGGGLFGFITGMIIVGMLSIGFEMLPFGDTVLTFARMRLVEKGSNQPVPETELAEKDPAQLEYARRSLWLKQDEFTVALVSHLSGNALAGRSRLGDVYPDFMAQAWRSRARMGEDMQTTAKGSMEVDGYWDLKPNEFCTRERLDKENRKKITPVPAKAQPTPGYKRIAVRAAFQDVDRLVFTPEQVRLVARDGRTGEVGEYLLAGINEPKAGNKLIQVWAAEVLSRAPGGKDNKLDLVFEVPEGIEFDDTSFVEVKQNLRAEITPDKEVTKKRPGALGAAGASGASGAKPRTRNNRRSAEPSAPQAEPPSPAPQPRDSSPKPKASSGKKRPPGVSNVVTEDHDLVSGIGPARWAGAISELPFVLTNYAGDGQVSEGAIKGGHVTAPLGDDWQPLDGNASPLDAIQVPSDMRLIQVSVEKEQAGSYLGHAAQFASDKLADFYLVDTKGGKHMPIATYAMAKVSGGKPVFEMIVLDETARQGEDVFAKMPAFQKITRLDLKGDYAFYFVFQVKPGTKAEKIHTGRTDVKLDNFKVVAPE